MFFSYFADANQVWTNPPWNYNINVRVIECGVIILND